MEQEQGAELRVFYFLVYKYGSVVPDVRKADFVCVEKWVQDCIESEMETLKMQYANKAMRIVATEPVMEIKKEWVD